MPAKGPVARQSWESLMADAQLHMLGEIVFICKDLHICSNIVFSTILAERRSKEQR